MTVNPYFSDAIGQGVDSERSLVESNVAEMIAMAGFDFYYIPRAMFAQDKFYHEVPAEQFNDYHKIEMYITNVSDFGGQGDFLSKFGLNVDDTVELLCSRFRFEEESGIGRPSEGDLIYFPLSKHLFEIDFVEDEPGAAASVGQFYSLSRLYTYLLKCTLFVFSYEDFDTGIEEIDGKLDADTYETPYATNEEINDEAHESLDWSEENPFGRTTD